MWNFLIIIYRIEIKLLKCKYELVYIMKKKYININYFFFDN